MSGRHAGPLGAGDQALVVGQLTSVEFQVVEANHSAILVFQSRQYRDVCAVSAVQQAIGSVVQAGSVDVECVSAEDAAPTVIEVTGSDRCFRAA